MSYTQYSIKHTGITSLHRADGDKIVGFALLLKMNEEKPWYQKKSCEHFYHANEGSRPLYKINGEKAIEMHPLYKINRKKTIDRHPLYKMNGKKTIDRYPLYKINKKNLGARRNPVNTLIMRIMVQGYCTGWTDIKQPVCTYHQH